MNVDNVLTLKTDELNPREWRVLFDKLRYTDGDNNLYEPWKVLPHKKLVKLPRGSWFLLPDSVRYSDKRLSVPVPQFDFTGKLDSNGFSGQMDAVKRMLEEEQGLVIAQPGFGKTEVALAFFSVAMERTLVLVHTKDILQQWHDRAEKLVPTASIGAIGAGYTRYGSNLTIATVQTFKRMLRESPEIANWFGCVILDEAHHAPAGTFDEILNKLPAKYRFGFTATATRADGKHPYMKLVIGPIIYKKDFKAKVPVEVFPVKSHNFKYQWRGSWDWRGLVNALIADDARNDVIASIADAEIRDGHSVLILSREIDHLQNIQESMNVESWAVTSKLVGSMPKDLRASTLDDFRAGKIKCLLATQLADEALDVPILDRIILTYPGKHDGRIIQQVGRALREHPGKTEAVIYDVVDDKVGVLRHQWLQRKQAYSKMKIKVRKLRVK